MPKSKRSSFRRLPPAVLADPRQRGLHAFQAGRFAEAIVAWTPLAERDPAARAALAEAHFRRALATPPLAPALDDLRRAAALAPDQPRYRFHLGRYLHRSGDLAAASEQYRAVLRRYYRGVAAARAGDTETAQKLWQRTLEAGFVPARLRENLAVLLLEQLTALIDTGDVAGAAALAQRSIGLPGNAAFDELRLLA